MSVILFIKSAWTWIRENVMLMLVFIILGQVLLIGCQRMRVNYLKKKIDRIIRPDNPDGRRRIFPIFREDKYFSDDYYKEFLEGQENLCPCDPCECNPCTCGHCEQ